MATMVYAVATSPSTAATAVILPRHPTIATTVRFSALPNLPARSFSSSIKQIKASEDASFPIGANELFTDLKEKLDALENKSTVIVYGEGGIVAICLSSILIGAINFVSDNVEF